MGVYCVTIVAVSHEPHSLSNVMYIWPFGRSSIHFGHFGPANVSSSYVFPCCGIASVFPHRPFRCSELRGFSRLASMQRGQKKKKKKKKKYPRVETPLKKKKKKKK